ncbi:MAG: hypothetical protein OEY38_07405 [Gammaproteobacteria bacterium]|nr:hypothetical protein [Gammaproteobacteria bacterium]
MDNKADIAQHNRKLNRRSTWVSLVAIVMLSLVTVAIVKNTYFSFKQSSRHNDSIIQLKAFHAPQATEAAIPARQTVSPNQDLVFTVSTPWPIHTALLLSIDDQTPQLVFKGAKIPPGENRRFENLVDRYHYVIPMGPKHLRFCLLTADDAEQLNFLLQHEKNFVKNDARCLSLSITTTTNPPST